MTRKLYILDQGLKGLGGHYYEYVRSIVESAEAVGLQCVVGCHKQAGDGKFGSFEAHAIFRDDVWASIPGEDANSTRSMNGVSARFIEDLQELLARHPAQPGDIFFLPNIARPHLLATALMAETFGPQGVQMHFMLRYPSSHLEAKVTATVFRRLEAAASQYSISLCTDSHRLADNLASLTSLPFSVLPIPHTWRLSKRAQEADDPSCPLHCVSLGNARDEKGIAEILEAVRLSAAEPWGDKLRFTLQVNDPYHVEEAIEAFRAGPGDHRTTLIDEPLGSEEYAALLESADVVLVPYWRSIYRERTSGVFLEGLVTGKLVLCTRDTWMSDLLDVHGGGVAIEDRSGPAVRDGLHTLILQREELRERARAAAEYWRKVHCPENLIAHLTGDAPRNVSLARNGRKAAVFFPWGEAVSGNTGASLRLKYFVRYMESIYEEIRIVFAGGSEPGGVLGSRSPAEPIHYSEDTKELHEQLKAVCRKIGVPEEDCFHLWFHLWPERDSFFVHRCEEMIRWADHVYVDYTYFVPVVDKLCRKYGKDYTLTIHDIVSDQVEGTPFLHGATRRLELDAAKMAPRVVCISQADRSALESGGVQAEVIPPPIDTQEARSPFSIDESRAILHDLYSLPIDGRHLCFFVGSRYGPNIEAADAVAEMARRSSNDPRLRDVLFVVAGACMQQRKTNNFAALGQIEGAALSACMSLADIMLVPLTRGTGVSLKSVEGLARGSLILSTSVGMRGLDVKDGVQCRIEDDLLRFPDRIAEILADREGARRIREQAQRFGEQFDFRRLMALYVPGSHGGELAEAEQAFQNRRERAIGELLPRLRNAQRLSPPLSELAAQYADASGTEWASFDGRFVENEPTPMRGESAPLPDDFDADWYLAAYPDVAMLGMDPAEHYSWIGRALGRSPNSSSKKKVLSMNG